MPTGNQAEVSMGRLLLNCDLGENESAEQTRALMQCVDAANIGCGVHAGSLQKTRDTLQLAQEFGVKVGAHPGLAAAGGRGAELPSPMEFRELLSLQLETFFEAAESVGADVHHIKLHGSLYSAVERDTTLADVYLEQLREFSDRAARLSVHVSCKPLPSDKQMTSPLQGRSSKSTPPCRGGVTGPGCLKVFALSGGAFSHRAIDAGIEVIPELFADRGYQANGMLVPRSEPGALIHSVDAAVGRIRVWQESGAMPTVSGSVIPLEGSTLCVHSDSPQALELLRALRAVC